MKVMRLQKHAHRKPLELSSGQQQRTALVRALARKPGLFLMDEPFAALDEDLRVHLREEVKSLQSRFDIPVLFVTHRFTEAYYLAKQLIVIDPGRVIQNGSRDSLFRAPSNPKVARLMGMSNILETFVEELDDSFARVDWKGIQLIVERREDLKVGSQLRLGLRPDEVMVIRRHRPVETLIQENLLSGKLIYDQPMGFDHLVTIQIETQTASLLQLEMRIPHPIFSKLDLALGEIRSISIKPSSFNLYPTT
jgi:ABC-type sugar transport system ATPase subunit